MNDSYYEQLVARRSRPIDMVIRVLTILVLIAVFILGFPFLGMLNVPIILVLGFLAWYFIFPKLKVEYEYLLVNHEMQIDAIYNKAKRKKLLTFDIRDAEMIAPKNSPWLRAYSPQETRNFTSLNNDKAAYAVMLPLNQKFTCILIEPDEKMLKHIKDWMGSRFRMD